MAKVELEATTEAREATLELAGAEAIADLTDAAVAAYAGGARELVFDLRTRLPRMDLSARNPAAEHLQQQLAATRRSSTTCSDAAWSRRAQRLRQTIDRMYRERGKLRSVGSLE